MTAPVVLPQGPRLAAVAGWDVSLLRGAVVTLAAVEGRLQTWRTRAGAIARSLESPECWSGPAADSSARVVLELDAVAAAVHAGLAGSLAAFERLADEADTAQEQAARTLVLARTLEAEIEAGLRAHAQLAGTLAALLPDAAPPDLGQALAVAQAALTHAASATAAAVAAGDALDGLGVRDAFAPADFRDLADHIQLVGPFGVPSTPEGRGGARPAADWWAGLSTGEQLLALRSAPELIGATDGLPAWARDRANRLLLDRALNDAGLADGEAATARAVAARIGIEEAAGRQVQLHLFDLRNDEVVLGIGDLDTAEAVGLLVPGIFKAPADDLDGLTGDAHDVAGAARAAAPGLVVATVVWLGYQSPNTPAEMATRFAAVRGGRALSATLDGMAAAREAAGTLPPRTSVLAHSYGTVVLDEAADVPGRLAADAVVLLGSPGMEPPGAAGLEAREVYDAAAVGDPVSWLGWFGMHSWARSFGAIGLPVEPFMGHSDYYHPAYPTLGAIGEVVAGTRAG
jgi:hypothetical protein